MCFSEYLFLIIQELSMVGPLKSRGSLSQSGVVHYLFLMTTFLILIDSSVLHLSQSCIDKDIIYSREF